MQICKMEIVAEMTIGYVQNLLFRTSQRNGKANALQSLTLDKCHNNTTELSFSD